MLCGIALASCSDANQQLSITADSIVVVNGITDSARVRVSVAGEATRIAGRYEVDGGRVVFRPAFPFDPAREYTVVVDSAIVRKFSLPALTYAPSVRVNEIYPVADTLPENLLRIYIEFTGPMSRESGLPFVKLLDANGREVKDAFLPIDGSFWNDDHTRFTLFLDPGRVKRDILPNREMGRAMVAGRSYTIVVDRTWKDGRGQPLVYAHNKHIVASRADYRPISLAKWRLDLPAVNTTGALVIHFDKPLDHAMLNRAIGVRTGGATQVEGDIQVTDGDRAIRFIPTSPWKSGSYHVLVLDFLEDAMGNRINRAFEVDNFEHVDSTAAPSRYLIPFRIR